MQPEEQSLTAPAGGGRMGTSIVSSSGPLGESYYYAYNSGRGGDPSSLGASGVDDHFHLFDEVDESDINMIHMQSPRRPLVRKGPQAVLHYLSLTFGQLNFFILWRFVSIAFNMTFDWSSGVVYALNYFAVYFITLIILAWPAYLFEFGISAATAKENVGAMASLSKRSRVASLNWVMSLLLLLTTVPLAGYAAVYFWEASEHWANFSSPGYKAKDALDLYVGRECTKYSDYVPHLSPLLCGPRGKRMDITCYDEDQCHLWTGNGRCLAVPWAPASEYLFTSKEEYDPMLDQDYPQYCAARTLHDITTNHAKAVMNHKGLPSDWKGKRSPRLPIAFSVVLILASGIAIMSAIGVNGNKIGSVCRITAQITRTVIGMFGALCIFVLMIKTMIWWNTNKTNTSLNVDWNKALANFNFVQALRPDIWAYSVVQALLTLRVGTGQNELVGSRLPERSHMMIACLSHLMLQTAMCVMLFVSCWLAYGITAMKIDPSTEPERPYTLIRFDLRNAPYGTIFTSLQTMFDNTASLNGDINDTSNFGTAFWFGMALLGVNGVSHALDVCAGAMALSSWNWRGGSLVKDRRHDQKRTTVRRNAFVNFCGVTRRKFSNAMAWLLGGSSRWAWTCIFAGFAWVITIQQWFGSSWTMTLSYHHYNTHLLYPFMILFHMIAMAWMVNHDSRTKHFGKSFTFVQLGVFIVGCVVASFCACATWRHAPIYSPIIGCIVGVAVMLVSIPAAVPFVRTHDAYGRRHEESDKWRVVLLGSADHVRNELNLRCCHNQQLKRISLLSTIVVRYLIIMGVTLSIANTFVSGKKLLWKFSPYVPFDHHLLSDQFLVMQSLMERHDLVRIPVWLVVLACIAPFIMVLLAPVWFAWPYRLDWLVPYDVDDTFFEVREAIEKFAATSKALAEAPLNDEVNEPIRGLDMQSCEEDYATVLR